MQLFRALLLHCLPVWPKWMAGCWPRAVKSRLSVAKALKNIDDHHKRIDPSSRASAQSSGDISCLTALVFNMYLPASITTLFVFAPRMLPIKALSFFRNTQTAHYDPLINSLLIVSSHRRQFLAPQLSTCSLVSLRLLMMLMIWGS